MNRLLSSATASLLVVLTSASLFAQDNIVLKNGTEIGANVLEVTPTAIKYRRQDNPNGPVYTAGRADVLLIQYANGTKDILDTYPAHPQPATLTPEPGPAPALNGLRYQTRLFSRHFTNEQDGRLSNRAVRSLLLTQPDALRSFDSGQRLRRLSYVAAGGAAALLGTGLGLALSGDGEQRDGTDADGSTAGTTSQTNRNEQHRGDGPQTVGYALAGGGLLLGVAALVLNHRATVAFRRAANHSNQPTAGSTSLHIGPGERGVGVRLSYSF